MDLSLTGLMNVVLKLVGVAVVGGLLYWLCGIVQQKIPGIPAMAVNIAQILIAVVCVVIVIFIVLAFFGIR